MGRQLAGVHYIAWRNEDTCHHKYSLLLVRVPSCLQCVFYNGLLMAFDLRERADRVFRKTCSAMVMGRAPRCLHRNGAKFARLAPGSFPRCEHIPVADNGIAIVTLL